MSSGYHEGEFIGAPTWMPLPAPYAEPRYVVFRDFMPEGWSDDLREWGVKNRRKLHKSADPYTLAHESGYHLREIEKHYGPMQSFFEQVQEVVPQALVACQVEPREFDHLELEAWIAARNESQCFHWHTDTDEKPWEEQTRLLSVLYYMRSHPARFFGGELELFDGTMIEPWDNLCVMMCPHQTHRVRPVHSQPMGPPSKDKWPAAKRLTLRDVRWNLSCWVHAKND